MSVKWYKHLPKERRDYALYYLEALVSAYRTVVISYKHLIAFYKRVLKKPEAVLSVNFATLASA